MREDELIRKLKLVETMHAGATTEGEKVAAAEALNRIRLRLEEERSVKQIEFTIRVEDQWQRRLLVSLMRRYGIKPYRYPRQRYTTVMARMPQKFVADVLWPEYQAMSATLREYMSGVTDRILSETIHADQSDAEVVEETRMIE